MNEILEKSLGRQCNSDGWFTKRARLLQSMYRAEKECGVARDADLYGNCFAKGAGENLNFLSASIYVYVKERIKNKTKWETIQPQRMLRNALSSQPMAFNLFVPLMELLAKGYSKQLTSLFMESFCLNLPDNVCLREIIPEFIPNYDSLGTDFDVDKTAMDVKLEFAGEDGKRYLVAVEVKYTDKLGTNISTKHQKIWKVLQEENRFKDDIPKMDQLLRNYLMCEECRVLLGYEACFCRVLAPNQYKNKSEIFPKIESFNERLNGHFMVGVSLEDFVKILLALEELPKEYNSLFKAFWDRYLNFDKLC